MPNLSTTAAIDPAAHETFSTSDRKLLLQLDSWGLTSDQYRVYCHLLATASVNKVAASINAIAKVCKLGRTTVVRVLSKLLQMKLISRQTQEGKESNFILLPYEQWKQQTSTTDERVGSTTDDQVSSKVLQMKHSKSTSTEDELVPQTAGLEEEISTPLRGVDIPPPKPVPQTNQVVSGTSSPDEQVETELTITDLDSKLATARTRWSAGTWFNDLGEQMVTVNCFTLTVSEFMKRSLDSFDHTVQACAEGLAMFKAQIEKIKQRRGKLL